MEFKHLPDGKFEFISDELSPSIERHTVEFSPPGLFRLHNVTITEGWDIDYVQLANLILPAFRKSPFPLCTPASRIIVFAQPWMWGPNRNKEYKELGIVTITGEILEV